MPSKTSPTHDHWVRFGGPLLAKTPLKMFNYYRAVIQNQGGYLMSDKDDYVNLSTENQPKE